MQPWLSPEDLALTADFESTGFIIRRSRNRAEIESLRDWLISQANDFMDTLGQRERISSLEYSHQAVSNENVNNLRVHLYNLLNLRLDLPRLYFELVRPELETLVGSELAMQRSINLSIQQPRDPGSVLSLHSDALAGDSPFQVVQWLPLTSAAGTNSMQILDPESSRRVIHALKESPDVILEEACQPYRHSFRTLEVTVGDVVIFNSTCIHGNVENLSACSRWSLNCRFIPLLSPWISAERRLGNFYRPITMRSSTRIGLDFLRLVGEHSAQRGESTR